MSNDIVNREFNLWLENLTASTAEVTSALQAAPINLEDLREHFDEMEVDASQLESFRPISSKKVPYDFSAALSPLATAKRLAAKVNRVLVKAGDIPIQQQSQLPPQNPGRKIPEVEIIPFDGDITQFANFMTAFELKFNNLPISKSEKLTHLRKLVTEGPFKVISALEINDENYDRAITKLKTEYENEEEVINALYRKLENLSTAKDNSTSIKNMYYEVEGLLSALESHGHDIDKFPPLRDRVYFRYPLRIVERICFNSKVTIKEFQSEILKHVQLRTSLEASSKNSSTAPQPLHSVTALLVATKGPGKKHENKPTDRNNANTTQNNIPSCAFCTKRHYSADCQTYTTVAVRKPLVKDRCYFCLSKYHNSNTCDKLPVTCRYCKQVNRHHSSLCPVQFKSKTTPASATPEPTKTSTQADNNTTNKTGENPQTGTSLEKPNKEAYFIRTHQGAHVTALLTVQNPRTKRKYTIRALFDNGSNESYVSEAAARRMGLELSDFRTVPVSVFLKSQPINLRTASTSFTLTNNDDFHITVVADTAHSLPQNVHLFNYDAFKELYPEHANKTFVNQAQAEPIEMLLGSDYFYDLLENKIAVAEGLYLYSTKFGWLLVGRQASNTSHKATFFQMSPVQAVKEICELDSLGIKEMPLSSIEEEERALNQFYENLEFIDGRYQIGWPWREYPPELPDNFGLAIGRLKSQQRKLTETSFQKYNAILQTQIDSGIVEEVPLPDNAKQCYYLPHHVIETPEKSTTDRMVFDGSAKIKKKKSINDAIYKGINLLAEGGKIIIRFRLRIIAVVSDIEKAFHMLGIRPCDRNFVRFLWLWDFRKPASGRNLRLLRFMRLVFGIVASPFILNATLRYHLMKYLHRFALQILRDLYADNLITGFSSLQEALEFYQFAINVFKDCSMNLRRWATNDDKLRSSCSQPDLSAAISVLGIIWNQYTDKIHLQSIAKLESITLRSVLSSTAQFYDPCGWWAPILISAKIFIRELHTQYDWDTELSENHREKWYEISTQLQLAAAELFPRFQCDISDGAKYSLHVFTDASIQACACVVYLRRENGNEVSTHLIFAKTKLAKISDVPKLELIAVLLGVKALEFVREAIQITIDKQVLWCDSKCVLHWLTGTKLLPTFIQRRVDTVRSIANLEYRYVPSAQNSADVATRECSFQQIMESIWFNGPVWLLQNIENWPPVFRPSAENLPSQIDILNYETPTTVLPIIAALKYPFDINPANFSSYLKLLRVTLYVMKFLSTFTLSRQRNLFPSTSICSAQLLWIKAEQSNHYADIIIAIQENKKHELVAKLNLYLDPKEIIRCAGRFTFAPLSPQERFPILLPKPVNSIFVGLLVQYYHETSFHAGVNYVLNIVRRKFWIPAGRHSLHNILKKCTKCKRFTSRPYQQPQQSDLPPFRLDDKVQPFANIGIDLFGHLWVQDKKRYVLLITDLCIRAVQLELLEDASTDQIWLALRRVFAQHCTPKFIVSDNAQQFKVIEQICTSSFTHQFTWKFIPEHSPWMGGVYERMVGMAKSSLLKTFHGVALTDVLLRTVLTEIASALNDRPLTYITAENEELETITPNYFLKSYFKETDMSNVITSTEAASRIVALAKYSQEVTNRFWAVWRTTYLQFLREKGFSSNQSFSKRPSLHSPKLNDVVLISERLIKRSKWKLGKIIELNPSADGQIRSVKLRTAHGVLIRPLNEVYPLEITDEQVSSVPAAIPAEQEAEDEWDNPIITVEEVFE